MTVSVALDSAPLTIDVNSGDDSGFDVMDIDSVALAGVDQLPADLRTPQLLDFFGMSPASLAFGPPPACAPAAPRLPYGDGTADNVEQLLAAAQSGTAAARVGSQEKEQPAMWTVEEDLLIVDLVETIGKRWNRIAAALPGRTENGVRNRCAHRSALSPATHRSALSPGQNAAQSVPRNSPLTSPAPLCVSGGTAWRRLSRCGKTRGMGTATGAAGAGSPRQGTSAPR